MDKGFVRKLQMIFGTGAVLTDPASLLVYSYDSALDKALPGAVVLPTEAAQVAAVLKLASQYQVPFVARGAGTNLCGASIPPAGGLVIHLSRLNRILSIDPRRRRAVLEPGVINLHLQKAVAAHRLFYAPDPASQKACTLGGNVGTNAGGPHCLKLGVTTNHVEALEVVLPDGEIARTSVASPGFDTTALFVGSEGTLGIVTRLEVSLVPIPETVCTLLASFPSIEAAVQTVTDIISAGVVPTTLELMDQITVEAVEDFIHAGYPRGEAAVLLIEVDGDRDKVEIEAREVEEICRRNDAGEIRRAKDEREREKLWEGRRGAYPSMARLAPNVLVEDGVVPRTRLPEAVRRIRAIAEKVNARLGLIAHAGDGNLHPNMIFDERNEEETRKVKAAGHEMLRVCVELGGSISGEHGIGTDKREAMKWLFTPATLDVFRRIKTAFDPANLSNPDKLIPQKEEIASTTQCELSPEPLPEKGEIAIRDVDHLQRILRSASPHRRGIYLKGLGTKAFQIPPDALALNLSGMNGVVEHDKADFTLTVQAGVTLEQIHGFLSSHQQFVHIAGKGTLGGIISAGSTRSPRLRDQLLGLKAVLPNGELATFGGKVMKNVAGYDAARLFIGAWGTLGVIVEVSLRLFPFPSSLPSEKTEQLLASITGVNDGSPSFSWSTDPLCRRIKNAFDPQNILNPSVFGKSFTEEPIVRR